MLNISAPPALVKNKTRTRKGSPEKWKKSLRKKLRKNDLRI